MQYLSFCKTESFRKLRTRAILEMQFFFFTFNSRHRKAFLFGKSNVEGKPQYKKEMFLVNFPSLHLIWDKNLNTYLTRLHWILFLTNSPPQIKGYSKSIDHVHGCINDTVYHQSSFWLSGERADINKRGREPFWPPRPSCEFFKNHLVTGPRGGGLWWF